LVLSARLWNAKHARNTVPTLTESSAGQCLMTGCRLGSSRMSSYNGDSANQDVV
jgi:hypothetical protein